MRLNVGNWFQGLSPPGQNLLLAVALLLSGLVLGVVTAWLVRRVLLAFGVDAAVEGTAFERAVRRLGTSTVRLLAQLCGLFVFVVAAIYAVQILQLFPSELIIEVLIAFLPRLFVAVLVVIFGLLIADKAELVIDEHLRSIKLPEITVVSTLVKLSILYVAALIALSQLGVATAALLVLLAAYAFGICFLGGLAFRDLLSSGAAGIYLLLTQPYSIGDEVAIDGRRGIVQEINVFVTHVEREGQEYIVPNRKVLRDGAMRVRD